MIETIRDARLRDAIRKAHSERAAAFANILGRIFTNR
jgi:hypothetical protein